MTETAAALFEKADHALRAARTLLDAEEADGCINRAYYACFHAASAALIEAGETPKTHKGTHNRFWVLYVEAGRLPREVAEVLSFGWRMREKADYDVFSTFDVAAAGHLLEDAEAFVRTTRAVVEDPERR